MQRLLVSLIVISQFLSISCGDGTASPDLNFELSDHILDEFFVTAIAFDSKEVAWIGTLHHGLIKYNGTVKLFDKSNSTLPDSIRINSIAIDNNDVVWIGSNKGLIKYENEIFHIYNKSNAPLVTDNVYALTVDKNNSIWFTSCMFRTGGIMKFDGTNWKLLTPQNSPLPGSLTSDIIIDNNNHKWATINEGNDGCTIVKISGDNISVYGEEETNIPLYYFGNLAVGQNNIIYASLNYMLSSSYEPTRPNIISFDGKAWKVIDTIDKDENSLGYVDKIATDLNGNLWASTSRGLAVYNGQEWNIIESEIKINSFSGIIADKNNRIWAYGSDGVFILE